MEFSEPHCASPMQAVLSWLATQRRFTIVQVGAYVGESVNDPLYGWLRSELPRHPGSTVVLVEPVAEYFEQLRAAYSGLDVRFENVAITDEEGERDFYRLGVDPAAHGQPGWLAQLGSLRADRMGALWDGYERDPELRAFWTRHRVVDRVRCTTLSALLAAHDLTGLDLLQIDAEGSDYDILRTVDLERLAPRVVNYERVLLIDDEAACRTMMRAAGYVLLDWGQDTLCIRPASS